MESIATFSSGASLAQQTKFYPLNDLAVKARHLAAAQNRLENNNVNGVRSLNMRQGVSTAHNNKNKELMEVAKKFEAILIHQMLKAMRKTVHKSDLLNSFSLQQYESMMDEEVANEMVKHKGIGLADSLFYQLSRLEETSNRQTQFPINSLGSKQYE